LVLVLVQALFLCVALGNHQINVFSQAASAQAFLSGFITYTLVLQSVDAQLQWWGWRVAPT